MPTVDHCNRSRTPVCPHCGLKMTDAWEIFSGHVDSTSTECGYCEKEFAVTRFIDVTYTTAPVGGWKEAPDGQG